MRSLLEGLDLLNHLLSKNSLAAVLSGPREIRTLDLLNAIETRSQLRYGPLLIFSLGSHGAPNSPGRGLRALWTLANSSK